jgi:hypothetical protein
MRNEPRARLTLGLGLALPLPGRGRSLGGGNGTRLRRAAPIEDGADIEPPPDQKRGAENAKTENKRSDIHGTSATQMKPQNSRSRWRFREAARCNARLSARV